ncbi:uracil phosphoribosyltransferase [Acidiluteibacter ferrifornacis]|jgi:uracil phosphoribosyltransferase|uniref:Uracil phosphoribosyltransferase n=1 Tax=Acidiluteibacter ferrifornacis TaxID=2692424 RepID=A0A6N9NJJ2_9FLAO|nr:uracil phosphoribosyltransferase [Acidiluteibacter ferrifornacis]MBR9831686.1 uracil phosphoribosyltransferase [bacterium]NBG66032.1 uracil phosphoribosyltransferase [Acidiluteibacter ferrifornacis]|tara:strand:- start:152 stop:805 length:654 start_codon:yes stop_codon:yes gene_type:complete
MAKVKILDKELSIVSQFMAEIRDVNIQKDSMRFRRNLERVGEIFAYEISKTMAFEKKEVQTSLGLSNEFVFKHQPVIATILRAGLPLHQGLLNYFDAAQNGFISAYRKHHKDGSFDIELEYLACPSIEKKTLILSDPMIATGSSIVLAYKALLSKGKPEHVHLVSVIGSTEGLEYAKRNLPNNVTIWMAALDEELTAQSYIVPGLGDAGDLAFGEKE